MQRRINLLALASLAASAVLASAQTVPPSQAAPAQTGQTSGQIIGQTSTSHPLFTAAAQTTGDAVPTSDAPRHKHITSRDRDRAEQLSVEGTKALLAQDARKAMDDFQRAGELDPDNHRYGADEAIAREHLVTELVQQADKARLTGHDKTAQQALAEAFRLDPENPEVTQHYADVLADHPSDTPLAPADLKLTAPPVQIKAAPVVRSFHLRAPAQDVVRQVMQAYGVQPTFEKSVKNEVIRFDADGVNYAQAAHLLTLVTDTFVVPLDPARVMLVADTKANRADYQRRAIETVYLPGLDENERTQVGQIAREVFDAQESNVSAAHGALTVRAPQEDLAALNTTLTDLMQGRSEIMLDVRMFEIDRTGTRIQGILLPNQTTIFNIPSEISSLLTANASTIQQIISSGLASPGDYAAIAAILLASGQASSSLFDQPFAYFGNGLFQTGVTSAGASGNASLNISDVHSLDQMQLRVEDQQDEMIRSGTRYPIITSSYSNLAGSNLSVAGITSPGVSTALQGLGLSASSLLSTQETIPQVQYEDLGLTLHVQPHLTGDGDISLKLDLKLDSLEGATLNDIPVLDDREVTAVTAMRPGSTTLLVSNLNRQDANAVTGIPGLNELPGLEMGTYQNDTKTVMELAILITPHVIRRVHTERATPMIMLSQH